MRPKYILFFWTPTQSIVFIYFKMKRPLCFARQMLMCFTVYSTSEGLEYIKFRIQVLHMYFNPGPVTYMNINSKYLFLSIWIIFFIYLASQNIIFVKLIINQKRIYILPDVHQVNELIVLDADLQVYYVFSPLLSNNEKTSHHFFKKRSRGIW